MRKTSCAAIVGLLMASSASVQAEGLSPANRAAVSAAVAAYLTGDSSKVQDYEATINALYFPLQTTPAPAEQDGAPSAAQASATLASQS